MNQYKNSVAIGSFSVPQVLKNIVPKSPQYKKYTVSAAELLVLTFPTVIDLTGSFALIGGI